MGGCQGKQAGTSTGFASTSGAAASGSLPSGGGPLETIVETTAEFAMQSAQEQPPGAPDRASPFSSDLHQDRSSGAGDLQRLTSEASKNGSPAPDHGMMNMRQEPCDYHQADPKFLDEYDEYQFRREQAMMAVKHNLTDRFLQDEEQQTVFNNSISTDDVVLRGGAANVYSSTAGSIQPSCSYLQQGEYNPKNQNDQGLTQELHQGSAKTLYGELLHSSYSYPSPTETSATSGIMVGAGGGNNNYNEYYTTNSNSAAIYTGTTTSPYDGPEDNYTDEQHENYLNHSKNKPYTSKTSSYFYNNDPRDESNTCKMNYSVATNNADRHGEAPAAGAKIALAEDNSRSAVEAEKKCSVTNALLALLEEEDEQYQVQHAQTERERRKISESSGMKSQYVQARPFENGGVVRRGPYIDNINMDDTVDSYLDNSPADATIDESFVAPDNSAARGLFNCGACLLKRIGE
ncbi:unnamed protein product [Amoebophrya sp. A120]|nr:unnamed protein product [Amoebophrya sp. A120]|eukprot:GSA120T00023819001.1